MGEHLWFNALAPQSFNQAVQRLVPSTSAAASLAICANRKFSRRLLLCEVRRKNDGRPPQGGQMRLETIAALAVRLRETVRRLSQEWEAAQGQSSAAK